MRPLVLLAAAIFVVMVMILLRGRRGPGAHALLRRAETIEDIDPVISQIQALPMKARSLFFQRAINDLWAGYRRDLAIRLISAFGKTHSGEKIAQYWIKQALEVEPALANKELTKDYLQAYYRPTVAEECGLTGS